MKSWLRSRNVHMILEGTIDYCYNVNEYRYFIVRGVERALLI